MSENPFRELPPVNPYQPSMQYSPQSVPSSSNPLMVPAIFLLVLSMIFLGMILLSMPIQLHNMSKFDLSTPEGSGQMVGAVGSLIAWTLMSIAIIIGSICMIRMKGYSGAMTAAICASIPLCSPCFVLGIPFGIWAIIVLRDPHVKSRFR